MNEKDSPCMAKLDSCAMITTSKVTKLQAQTLLFFSHDLNAHQMVERKETTRQFETEFNFDHKGGQTKWNRTFYHQIVMHSMK